MPQLDKLLADLEEPEFLRQLEECLERGDDPAELLEECRGGMDMVGKRYETKEYFISDLVMAANIFTEALNKVRPRLGGDPKPGGTKIVLGTVQGDIHDIGKNIVAALFSARGFEVIDLGVNVPTQAFVDAVRESGARLVGLSALITTSFAGIRATVEAFAAAGLRSRVKILIGGGPVNEEVRRYAGADGVAGNAVEAVNLAESFSKEAA